MNDAKEQKARDCKNCKHYVITDSRTNWNSEPTTYIYGCEVWECDYEDKEDNKQGMESGATSGT